MFLEFIVDDEKDVNTIKDSCKDCDKCKYKDFYILHKGEFTYSESPIVDVEDI